MEYHKRKADKETESIRFWKIDEKKNKKEFEEIKDLKDGSEIVVKYKEIELNLTGFNSAFDKKTNELKMAWKVKPETKQLLYYIPNDNDLALIKPFLDQAKVLDFDVQNVKDAMKNIYNELSKKDIEEIKKHQEETSNEQSRIKSVH